MLKKLALLSIWLALPLCAQTINPNQVRPATTNGQVLTTVTANQPPSWQTPASGGVSVATTPPCTVNGGTGPVSSGTATITCANGTQTYYKQQGTGTYYQLIRPTGCSAPPPATGWTSGCVGNNAGFITINGTGSASLTYSFTGITPPAGATLIGAYVYGISSATGNTNSGEGFGTVGGGTGCVSGSLEPPSKGVNFAWPTGQGGCQLSTTSGLDTVQIEMNMIVSAMGVGGAASIDDVGIEVDYNVGPTPPASAILLIAPPLSLNNNVLGMGPIWPTAIYPTKVARLSQYAYTWPGTIVPVTDAVNSTDCATGGGSTLVDCVSDGSGGWTARSFTGGITALTGDVSATGPGSAAATVVKVNNGTIPTSQPCIGTNGSGQLINGTCGGAVASVSNVDGSLTISPNIGGVVASLNVGNANTWTATQTFSQIIDTALVGTATSPVCPNGAGGALTQSGCTTGNGISSGSGYALPAYGSGASTTLGPSNITTDSTNNNLIVPGSGTFGSGGSTHGLTFPAGTCSAGVAGSVVYCTDATNGYAEVNENNTGLVRLCDPINGACGSNVTNTTITTGTGAVSGTCSSNTLSSAVTMTGLTTVNTLTFTPTTDLSSVSGWDTGALYFVPVVGAGSFQWRLCTGNSGGTTPGGSVTWNVSAR